MVGMVSINCFGVKTVQIRYNFATILKNKLRISNTKRLAFVTLGVICSSDVSVFHMEFVLQRVTI